MPAPDVPAVVEYLGPNSASAATLAGALAAEKAAQATKCRVPADDAVWPEDLVEALKRRVACNLARRGLPIAVLQGDSGQGPVTIPANDPEVRRLEGPYRRLCFG